MTFFVRRQMEDDDECHAGRIVKLFERLEEVEKGGEAARRSTEHDNGKVSVALDGHY